MFSIKVNDRYQPRDIRNFNKFSLNLSFDSICDTFGFAWRFNEKDYDQKELLAVSHYHPCDVYYNDELIIAGIITNTDLVNNPVPDLVQIGGWSRPGVLEGSTVMPSNYPLQTQGLSIESVARKLCSPYNVKIEIDSSVKSKMQSVVKDDNIKPTETIKSYLQKITEVKRIIMTHTHDGKLLFTSAKTKELPVFVFDNENSGSFPACKFKYSFKGENMHRFITVMQQSTTDGTAGGQATIRNPYVINTYPKDKVITVSSGIADDMPSAARQELSKELQNITLTVELYDWKIGDEIIKPGKIITVYDEKLYIYKKVNWFIRSVNYTADETSVRCTLTCVLPEVFNNDPVESIFKGINIHGKTNGY